jgi:hypothetical protein
LPPSISLPGHIHYIAFPSRLQSFNLFKSFLPFSKTACTVFDYRRVLNYPPIHIVTMALALTLRMILLQNETCWLWFLVERLHAARICSRRGWGVGPVAYSAPAGTSKLCSRALSKLLTSRRVGARNKCMQNAQNDVRL